MTNLANILEAKTGEGRNVNVEKAIISYMFRLIPVQEFNSKIQTRYRMTAGQTLEMRASLNGSGYMQQSLKPFLFWHWHKNPTEERMLYMASRYGVHEEDISLIHHMGSRVIDGRMESLAEFRAYTPNKIKRILNNIPIELDLWTNNLVWSKMRFLLNNHNGVDHSDLKLDCLGHGIYSFLNTYPRIKSPLHAINVSKSGIYHHALKIIEQMTTAKRATMLKENGRFVHLIDNIPIEDHIDLGKEYVDEHNTLVVMDTSLNFVGMEKEAVIAMSGLKSLGFSEWLHSNAYEAHKMDNDALYDYLLDEEDEIEVYNDYLMDYMGLHWTEFDSFRQRVIHTLGKKPVLELA